MISLSVFLRNFAESSVGLLSFHMFCNMFFVLHYLGICAECLLSVYTRCIHLFEMAFTLSFLSLAVYSNVSVEIT